ncbi:MAG: helix-turn-helix transcriptional regulator [Labilithrix sp.]|nr:helix-turn-helix transcriptional regulator [Labilithrix sp.]MBX3217176.1 helix-turn-helix transcriptional regulator [Labilithrix sp.]
MGERVRAARLDAGLTQEEAAARSGIDYKRWQRIEHGIANPTVATLARIALALKVNLTIGFSAG